MAGICHRIVLFYTLCLHEVAQLRACVWGAARSARRAPPSQLRNLLWATSKHDVYVVLENRVNHWSALSRETTTASLSLDSYHMLLAFPVPSPSRGHGMYCCRTSARRASHHVAWLPHVLIFCIANSATKFRWPESPNGVPPHPPCTLRTEPA